MYQFNRLCQGFNEGYNISLLFNLHRLDTETIKNKSIFYAINNDKTYARELSRYIADVQNKIPVGTQYYKFFGIGFGGYQYVNEFQPYLSREYKIKAYRVNQFKIGGSGIGKRSGTKDHDGEPFILFYKKVK